MHNSTQYKGEKEIRIYTPEKLSLRIKEVVNKSFKPKSVLDVCCGDFDLSKHYKNENCEVVGVDIEDPFNEQKDFVFYKDDFLNGFKIDKDFDLIVCNPPFNGAPARKLYPELFIKRIMELYPNTPIAFITPLSLLFNQRHKSKRWRDIKHHNISSIMALPLDSFFKTNGDEVLIQCQVNFYNFKEGDLKPFYFIED